MPVSFFTVVWPLVLGMIILAGFIVSIAALATLVTAITKARQLMSSKSSQAPEDADAMDPMRRRSREDSFHPDSWNYQESDVTETYAPDGVRYIPNP